MKGRYRYSIFHVMKNLVCVDLTAFKVSERLAVPFDIEVNTMASVVTFKKRKK